jgi:excisionase family DNA binding protein
MTLQTPSPWLTVREATHIAKCGPKTLRREIAAGRLRAARIGGRRDIRIHRDWIDEWLLRCAEPIEVAANAPRLLARRTR